MVAYATTTDLADRWRPLTAGAETTKAARFLDDASQLIREKAPTLDARLLAGTASALTAEAVVCEMVIRRLEFGPSGRSSRRVTVGGVSADDKFYGAGGLYLTRGELERLTPTARGVFSVSIATPDAD